MPPPCGPHYLWLIPTLLVGPATAGMRETLRPTRWEGQIEDNGLWLGEAQPADEESEQMGKGERRESC